MTTNTHPKRTAVIFAGEIFDGHDAEHPLIKDLDGNTHIVRVRAMPARHLGRIVTICTDEAALLDLVCTVAVRDAEGKITEWLPADPAWVDNLDEPSHVLLVEAAKRLNFSRAATWGKRQIEAGQMKTSLMLQTDEMLSPVVAKMAELLISSLKLSGSPAAPSTKS